MKHLYLITTGVFVLISLGESLLPTTSTARSIRTTSRPDLDQPHYLPATRVATSCSKNDPHRGLDFLTLTERTDQPAARDKIDTTKYEEIILPEMSDEELEKTIKQEEEYVKLNEASDRSATQQSSDRYKMRYDLEKIFDKIREVRRRVHIDLLKEKDFDLRPKTEGMKLLERIWNRLKEISDRVWSKTTRKSNSLKDTKETKAVVPKQVAKDSRRMPKQRISKVDQDELEEDFAAMEKEWVRQNKERDTYQQWVAEEMDRKYWVQHAQLERRLQQARKLEDMSELIDSHAANSLVPRAKQNNV